MGEPLTGFEIWLICYTEGASEGFYPPVIESIDPDIFEKTNLLQGTDGYRWAGAGWSPHRLGDVWLCRGQPGSAFNTNQQ